MMKFTRNRLSRVLVSEMKEIIGKVTLNYEYYDGIDSYSDGEDIEEKLLEICRLGKREEALHESGLWPVLYHLSDIRGNIIEWYPMDQGANILEIGSGCGAISGCLCKKVGRVVGIELSKQRSLINAYRNRDCANLEIVVGNFHKIELEEKFDYVTLIGVLEYAGNYMDGDDPYVQMLQKVKRYLKPNGKIIIAIENKMGLKYLNGAREDHIGKAFVGVEGYRGISGVRTFSKPELCGLLNAAGLQNYRFYYPVPDYKLPSSIYSDAYMPRIGDIRIWGENYNGTRIALYNEGIVFDQVCEDQKFDYFSNSFLVICNEQDERISYIHYTSTRNKEYQTKTVIIDKKDVEKSYLNVCARKYDIFVNMEEHFAVLQKEFPNIEYLRPEVKKEALTYPYIKGDSLERKLTQKLHNTEKLIAELKTVIDRYFTVNDDYLLEFVPTDRYVDFFGGRYVKTKEKALKITNIDMLLQNLVMGDNGVVCIDYEWVFDFPIPYEFVIYRCVEYFYKKYQMYIMHQYSVEQFVTEFGIKQENIAVYQHMNKRFYDLAAGEERLDNYRKASGMIEIKI